MPNARDWLNGTVKRLNVTIPKSRQEQQFQTTSPEAQILRQFSVPEFPESYPEDCNGQQRVLLPLYQDPAQVELDLG